LRSVSIGLLMTLICVNAAAQTSVHGTLTGRITDPSNAAIPAATLTLVNVETNAAVNVTSETDGTYVFARIAPGRYRLKVDAPGFAAAAREFTIAVNEAATADIRLGVGGVAETLRVEAGVDVVQSQASSVSLLMDETRGSRIAAQQQGFPKTDPAGAGRRIEAQRQSHHQRQHVRVARHLEQLGHRRPRSQR
jgi:hypothetical protein